MVVAVQMEFMFGLAKPLGVAQYFDNFIDQCIWICDAMQIYTVNIIQAFVSGIPETVACSSLIYKFNTVTFVAFGTSRIKAASNQFLDVGSVYFAKIKISACIRLCLVSVSDIRIVGVSICARKLYGILGLICFIQGVHSCFGILVSETVFGIK